MQVLGTTLVHELIFYSHTEDVLYIFALFGYTMFVYTTKINTNKYYVTIILLCSILYFLKSSINNTYKAGMTYSGTDLLTAGSIHGSETIFRSELHLAISPLPTMPRHC